VTILLTAGPAQAAPGVWQAVASSAGSTVEIDTGRITRLKGGNSGKTAAWTRLTLDHPVLDFENQIRYGVVEALNHYDCAKNTFTTQQRVFFLDNREMKTEKVADKRQVNARPDSFDARLMDAVCKPRAAAEMQQVAAQDAAPRVMHAEMVKNDEVSAARGMQVADKPRLFEVPIDKSKAGPIDVINTHSSTDSWLTALACATLSGAPPIVRTRHISAPIPNNMSSRWLYQSATSLIVTTGEVLRQQLINNNGFDPARIVSVTTGMDVDRYVPGDKDNAKRKLGIPCGQFLYGIVATLRFQKGHAELLRAFAEQNDPSCNLAIVGDGPQLQNINALIAELGLAERILMPGNQHDILPWYQAFDAFVLPTHAEGMPQSLMQAMLCALPVITTPVGSIPSVVEHEQTGLLISPKNISELSAAMRRIRLDPVFRQRLGASAREIALARFDIKRMLDDMECLFHKVAKGGTCN
jgi:glycosyltransferase involved in cell wall biosynthesis